MNFDQFYTDTFADFRPCATPRREPDFISASWSAYWDEGDHVIRCSDHWGRVASCWWVFDGCRRSGSTMTGMCRYADFWRRVRLTIAHQPIRRVAAEGAIGSIGAPGSATGLDRVGSSWRLRLTTRRRRRPRVTGPGPR